MSLKQYLPKIPCWSKEIKSRSSLSTDFRYPQDFSNHFTKTGLRDRNPFFGQFKRLIYALTIVGRFPFIRDASGRVKYSMLSYAGLYWIILFIIELASASEILKNSFFNMFGDSSFDVVLGHARNSLVMFNLLLLPLNHIREWKRLACYVNDWDKFLVSFRHQTGQELNAKFEPFITIFVFTIPLASLAATHVENESMGIVKSYHQGLYVLIFSGSCYCSLFFACCHTLVQRLADYLLDELLKIGDQSRSRLRITSNEIHKLRYLWVNGVSLQMRTGECMGVSMLVICLSNSACFVVAAYGFMSASIEKDYKSILHHLTNLVAGLAFLLVGCESAYRSSKKMGDNIIAALSVIDVANLSDPASREVNMFLQTVSLNPPVTMCAGIITLGRSFLTTTFSSTITYLIVLVQFKISDTEHAQINKTQIELRERWTMVQNVNLNG